MIMSRLLIIIAVAAAALILLRVIWGMLKSGGGRLSTPAKGGEMIQDPVCGVYLPKERAVEGHVRGKTHYFCSPQCLQNYRAHGEKAEVS